MSATPDNNHSYIPPSGAKSWLVCTAAPDFIQRNRARIGDTETEYSKEGTEAHDWASKILNGLADLSEVPDAMREPVAEYVAFCQRLKEPADTVLVEQKVPLFYRKSDRGTVDYGLVSEKRIYIADYKHGAGVMVDAKNNPQLAIYGRSLVEELTSSGLYDFPPDTLVIFAIVQPRAYTGDKIKLWSLTLADLMKFTDEIGAVALFIQDPANADALEFKPSDDACQFCAGKKLCVKRAEWLATPIPFDVLGTFTKEDIADNAFECLQPEQIVNLIRHRKEIVKWLSEVFEGAEDALNAGQEIEGLKLVQGNPGDRAWVNETEAETLVSKFIPASERYAPKKLLSVAQMEKVLKPHAAEFSTRFKNRLAELITRPAGKPTLVLADDPRPSVAVKVTEVFANENAALVAEIDPLS